MVTSNTYGRGVWYSLTNKSGGAVTAGDVVVVDTTNNDAFTTSTAGAFVGGVGVVQSASIASNAVGLVALSGYVSLVNTSASVTRGNFGKTHTVAKQAVDAGASRGVGTFCQFLTGGTTPDALLYPVDLLGSSLTNPMTAVGDLIRGGAAGAPTALVAVATGKVLASAGVTTAPVWGYPPFHGALAYSTSAQTINNTTANLSLEAELYDTDAFHDNSTNNSRMTIPAGMGGYYALSAGAFVSNTNAGWLAFYLNGTTFIRVLINDAVTGAHYCSGATQMVLAAGDYVEARWNTNANINIGAAGTDGQKFLAIALLGV